MEARRRHIGHLHNDGHLQSVRSDLEYKGIVSDPDDCCCEPLTPEIKKFYEEDSDDDCNANRRNIYNKAQAGRRPISDTTTYGILFTFLCFGLFIVNLRSNRELTKIKANLGFDEKPHPTEVHDFWWNSAVVYYLQPLYFQDSDNDGIGDIRGSNFSNA